MCGCVRRKVFLWLLFCIRTVALTVFINCCSLFSFLMQLSIPGIAGPQQALNNMVGKGSHFLSRFGKMTRFILPCEFFSSAIVNIPAIRQSISKSCKYCGCSFTRSVRLLAALQRSNMLTLVIDETIKRAARERNSRYFWGKAKHIYLVLSRTLV